MIKASEYFPTHDKSMAQTSAIQQRLKRSIKCGSVNAANSCDVYTYSVSALKIAAYQGSVLAPNNKIYFVPYYSTTSATWHYIDLITNTLVAYAHGATVVANAYYGGVLDNNGRIYLVPSYQATALLWHYIDTKTGAVVAYSHNQSGFVVGAYAGGVLAPNGRIYLVPQSRTTSTTWHYIDTNITPGSAGHVVAYSHGINLSNLAINGYAGGALSFNGRLYLAPRQQTTLPWHYIDVTTGNVVEYSHGIGASDIVSDTYMGATLAPNGRIYLIPYNQSTVSVWHYIDPSVTPGSAGHVVAYSHGTGITGITEAFDAGVLSPDGRIYLVPRGINSTLWYYINTNVEPGAVGHIVGYSHGVTAASSSAYMGGTLAPSGRIYMSPSNQSTSTTWHYIDTNCNLNWNKNLCLSPFFNKL